MICIWRQGILCISCLKKNNASFKMGKEFKNKFLKDLSEKCALNQECLKQETTIYGGNKWRLLKKLNDILLNDLNFKKGFIEE